MPRLRRVSPDSPGWTRRRAGAGFTYLDQQGARLGSDDVARVKSLAIPPAWRDVWICPLPQGHLQAVGTDDAGRRQYLYHPQWRARRDRQKFDRVLAAARHLPTARRRVAADLGADGMPQDRACALAVRLIDLGCFRIGSDAYADAHGSVGLTTLERSHVRRSGEGLLFRFVGKSGVAHAITIDDTEAVQALSVLRARRSPSPRLLAFRTGRTWHDLDAGTVNAYLSGLFDGEFTAKDFRTWHATVLAAQALALADRPSTRSGRARVVRATMEEVSAYLGNTPTIARTSYVDPRVVDLWQAGRTIDLPSPGRRQSPAARQAAVERAVLDLLG